MPAVMAGAGTSSIITLGRDRDRRGAARPAVRSAHQARAEHRRRARTHTPATSSATSPATSPRGATGSPAGPATRRSSRRGCSTSSRCSASTTRRPGRTSASRSPGCGSPPRSTSPASGRWRWFQNITVVLKFVPLLFVGVVGWFFVSAANFGPFNASGGSLYDGDRHRRRRRAVLVHRRRVRVDRRRPGQEPPPQRRAGVGAAAPRRAALLYVAVTAVVMGLVPHGKLVERRCAVRRRVQDDVRRRGLGRQARRARRRRSPASVRSTAGRWSPPRCRTPQRRTGCSSHPFAKVEQARTSRGSASSSRPSSPRVLMAWSYSGKTGLKVFTYLVYLSVVTVAIPYFFSACAQLATWCRGAAGCRAGRWPVTCRSR